MTSQNSPSVTVSVPVDQWRSPSTHRCKKWGENWCSQVGLLIYPRFEAEKSEQLKAKVKFVFASWWWGWRVDDGLQKNRTETPFYYVIHFKNVTTMLKKAFQWGVFTFRARSKFVCMHIGTSIFCPCLAFQSPLQSPPTDPATLR